MSKNGGANALLAPFGQRKHAKIEESSDFEQSGLLSKN